jgi:hypothetical protein
VRCVINQPNYIPWRGYFHQIYKADVFVFYDDVQYDKHGWRNRNRIKSTNGTIWLTIPVRSRGVLENRTPINRIVIDGTKDWARKHWLSIAQSYAKAPFFDRYARELSKYYETRYELLADLTIDLTIDLANKLGITKTQYIRSSSLNVFGSKTDRLLRILQSVGATHYISGPAAKQYLEEEKLLNQGISIEYMVYDYPVYPQLYPPFESDVSILDLLFTMGDKALSYFSVPNSCRR